MQPMNYKIDTGNVSNAFAQGFQNTSGMMASVAEYQKAQALATAQQQANEQAAYKRQRFSEVANNPSSKEVRRLYMEFPELHEASGKMLEHMTKEEQRTTQNLAFSVTHALKKGNVDAAMAILDQQIEAAKNSGNDEAAQGAEMLRNSLEVNPKVTEAQIQGMLFSTMGKDYAEIEKKLEEAETERLTRDGTVRKGNAEADIKEKEALYSADQLLADIGLKKAQTVESTAKAGQANAAAEKDIAAADQVKSGVIPPEKRQEAETKLREEYYKRTSDFQLLKDSYNRMEAAQDSAAGDISLIYGFMKMNDPTSVVREGEYATAANSGGIATSLQNVYNKALNGERLTPGQRKTFIAQAKALMNANGKSEAEVRKHLTGVAQDAGLNVKNIFTEEAVARDKGETPKAAPVANDALSRLMQKYGAK